MTKKQALKQLQETRQINTGMLKYLPMSFEAWLRYAQASTETRDKCVDLAIKHLTSSK